MKKVARWKRLLRRIRRDVNFQSALNMAYGHLEGVDHTVSYVNGYVAASKGYNISDYDSGAELKGAAVHCVWWRKGWSDWTDGKAMNPYAFAEQRYKESCERLRKSRTGTGLFSLFDRG